MEYDVIIVGAGPSGLACAIRLKQLAAKANQNINICILEKGSQVGAHIISGAVLEPKSLKELLPNDWQNAPLDTEVTKDTFYFLTKNKAIRLPTPKQMHNHGNYIISLGELCQFLAKIAENLGCEIYPSFAATDVLYNDKGEVIGVATSAFGIDKHGNKTANYQPPMHLHAKQTIFAEGCRGQLSVSLMNRFNLRKNVCPQTYGLGIKEIWRIPPEKHKLGLVMHSIGWPLRNDTYGGSFMYHYSDNRVSIGFVVGLDYKDTYLSPFEEMQKFKTHPFIKDILEGGERIAFGARAINEGGLQSLPKLTFKGGALIGDCAGFLNVPKIKGIHTAIKSAIIAAESCFEVLNDSDREMQSYPQNFKKSWLYTELYKVRNIRPGFKHGLIPGLTNAFFETYISFGHSPWTLKNHADHLQLENKFKSKPIDYPKPDNKLTFDRLSSVYLTNVFHTEDQPCHLKLRDPKLAIDVNYKIYDSPETRYCPAYVYQIVFENSEPKLQINAQNCIHCKTCDIKDPRLNIVWNAPEGGGGPNYVGM